MKFGEQWACESPGKRIPSYGFFRLKNTYTTKKSTNMGSHTFQAQSLQLKQFSQLER